MTYNWNARIRRARELSSAYPFAAEAMLFYARLATLQAKLSPELDESIPQAGEGTFVAFARVDTSKLLPSFSMFLSEIRGIAPTPLSQAADALMQEGMPRWSMIIEEFWQPESRTEAIFSDSEWNTDGLGLTVYAKCLVWLFLQPYAECLMAQRKPVSVNGTHLTCPVCGSKPIVGVLRPEGDGGKKSLVCMLCAHEWNFRRLCCPACGEEREAQMGFYTASEIPHVRVDVCDTCHTYLKTVDLTKTGSAVPIVDELATLPLDLWAGEHGYEKLQLNMLGL